MSAPRKLRSDPSDVSDSWSQSVTDDLERSRRIAWVVAGVAGAIALMLAIAILIMLPLKTVVPVPRQHLWHRFEVVI